MKRIDAARRWIKSTTGPIWLLEIVEKNVMSAV